MELIFFCLPNALEPVFTAAKHRPSIRGRYLAACGAACKSTGTRPTVRGAACKNPEPTPLFAAQPTKVFWLTFFSKKVRFKKAGAGAGGRLPSPIYQDFDPSRG